MSSSFYVDISSGHGCVLIEKALRPATLKRSSRALNMTIDIYSELWVNMYRADTLKILLPNSPNTFKTMKYA